MGAGNPTISQGSIPSGAVHRKGPGRRAKGEPTVFSLVADLIVLFHLVYVLFVVGGEAAILIGGILGWRWIRNLFFRTTHLAAIVVVAIEAIFGKDCPLTLWEYLLRRLAGQTVQSHVSFVGRLARAIVFQDLPPRFFTELHIAFGAAVLLTFILIPPRIGAGNRSGSKE